MCAESGEDFHPEDRVLLFDVGAAKLSHSITIVNDGTCDIENCTPKHFMSLLGASDERVNITSHQVTVHVDDMMEAECGNVI